MVYVPYDVALNNSMCEYKFTVPWRLSILIYRDEDNDEWW